MNNTIGEIHVVCEGTIFKLSIFLGSKLERSHPQCKGHPLLSSRETSKLGSIFHRKNHSFPYTFPGVNPVSIGRLCFKASHEYQIFHT